MSIYVDLMNDMYKERNRNWKEKNNSEVIGIRINPKWFHELAADKNSTGRITLDTTSHENPALLFHKVDGIGLMITKEVDKWDFLFNEGGR